MALARVVSFDGVDSERIASLSQEIEQGEQPEGMSATEMLLLHDPDADQALAIVFFENEDEYRKGDEILGSMPTGDTPGRRTSVTKYQVATRMTA
jgi:hypothetical protein